MSTYTYRRLLSVSEIASLTDYMYNHVFSTLASSSTSTINNNTHNI